jgi:hypothetical protein
MSRGSTLHAAREEDRYEPGRGAIEETVFLQKFVANL